MKIILLVVALGALIGMLLLALKLVEKQQGAGKAGGSDAEPPEGASEGPLPYEAKGALLSDAELRFLAVLEPAVAAVFGNEARISFQVPVGSVVQVRRGLERGKTRNGGTRWIGRPSTSW